MSVCEYEHDGCTVHEVDIPLHKGKPPLTLNQRLHWRQQRDRARVVRESVGFKAKAMLLGQHQHVTVQMHYLPGDNRRRDADNLVATQKHCFDGLVDSGLIPDDTPQHITWYAPQIHPGAGQPRRLWLAIHLTPEQP